MPRIIAPFLFEMYAIDFSDFWSALQCSEYCVIIKDYESLD